MTYTDTHRPSERAAKGNRPNAKDPMQHPELLKLRDYQTSDTFVSQGMHTIYLTADATTLTARDMEEAAANLIQATCSALHHQFRGTDFYFDDRNSWVARNPVDNTIAIEKRADGTPQLVMVFDVPEYMREAADTAFKNVCSQAEILRAARGDKPRS